MNMMKKKCVVIIPVWRSKLLGTEFDSFRQCLRVLRNYDICLITHAELDLSFYNKHAEGKELRVELFDKPYFSSVLGYNQLCLLPSFYERFSEYEYMLIYQLDAWVFTDELAMWCEKGYDYIGAPTFHMVEQPGRGVQHSYVFEGVGNGGFSLRRIEHCLRVLNSKKCLPFIRFQYLFKWYYQNERLKTQRKCKVWFRSLLKSVARGLGYRNTLRYFLTSNRVNEDFVFSEWARHSNVVSHVKLPDIDEAALFAFEVHPSYMYKLTGRLPFGCHAFEKREFDTFWKQYIQTHSSVDTK